MPCGQELLLEKQVAELLTHLNEKEFWRKFGVPTLSADDSYYNPIGYWNGPVWVQWDYLVFRGLMNYGYKNEAEILLNKFLEILKSAKNRSLVLGIL